MKRCLTCTLLCISISYFLRAQENFSHDIARISTPFRYFNGVSLNDKNFLFDSSWVKARLLTANNSIISNDSFLFNYDKIDHRLLITTDFKSVYEIDNREFKAILFYWHDSAYIFKHINFINDKDLFEVIINDNNKYSLYKVVRTKLIKGHYGGSGFSATNDRSTDVYKNDIEYYVFFPNREYRIIHLLKKASIERAFNLNPDIELVSEYLSSAGNKELYEEIELKQMILFLNKSTL
jgi:hypothetical protein